MFNESNIYVLKCPNKGETKQETEKWASLAFSIKVLRDPCRPTPNWDFLTQSNGCTVY